MSFPLLVVAPLYGLPPCIAAPKQIAENKKGDSYCLGVTAGGIVTTLFDLAATVTFLVIGILGAMGAFRVLGIPTAASWAFIGIGCAIPLLWGIGLAACCVGSIEPIVNGEED